MTTAASRRGILVIVSSPSGAGKTTLSRRLLAEHDGDLEFSVSYTTRPRRDGEVEGRDYCFVSPDRFNDMVERGDFAEHAEVHGNHYGTARETVERALSSGIDVVFDVDWQGGRSLKAQWPDDALMVFIVPPDLETLEGRLRHRATDSEAVISRRLEVALSELTHHGEYDHVVVNDDLELAYSELRGIYRDRRQGLPLDPERSSAARLHAERLVRSR